MTHVLLVVDMQNDFIDGIFANPEAQKIVPKVAELIRNWDGPIYVTLDTHKAENWMRTSWHKVLRTEMEKLPEHCIKYTQGWLLAPEIVEALRGKDPKMIEKESFAARDSFLHSCINVSDAKSITLVGLCTDICVVSNALELVSEHPYMTVRVLEDLCAGTTPYRHEAALAVMRSCLVEVTDSAHIRETLDAEVREKEEYNL